MMNMERPKLNIPMTLFEKASTTFCFLLLIGHIVYIGLEWSTIPDRVPIHYNVNNKPDSWGGKESIWLLPGIGFIILIGLTFLERVPHVYNYLVMINEENAERQYRNARLMVNLLKTEIILLFSHLEWKTIHDAKGIHFEFTEFPISLVVIFGTIIVFMIRSFILEKKSN